jgi:transcriptional regulator with XRE-family HTH domain
VSWAKPADEAQWRSDFGRRVVELRVAKGLSQMQLAHLADMDATYLSSVEQGRRNVGLINIHVLAGALGVDVAELFKAVGSGRRPSLARGWRPARPD